MAGKVGVIAGNMFDHILHKPRMSVKKNHQDMECDLPSGKRLHNYGKSPENHHFVAGKTHYFYCHFQ